MRHPIDMEATVVELQKVWHERSRCFSTERLRHLETRVRELSQIIINYNTKQGDK